MAGHSKWANIKHTKARMDAKRGKLFTKLIREITVAARMGGAEVDTNPRLRLAYDKAMGCNMPKDTIMRAIKRGLGADDSAQMMDMRYEGYGPGGVAVMVDCLTDNKNRTVAEVRHALTKCGGNMGTTGCVSYLFEHKGKITFDPSVDAETVMEIGLESGVEEVFEDQYDGCAAAVCAPLDFDALLAAYKAAGLSIAQAQVTWLPTTEVALDLEQAEQMLRMLDLLEDLDDVQEVYSNAQIAPAVIAELPR